MQLSCKGLCQWIQNNRKQSLLLFRVQVLIFQPHAATGVGKVENKRFCAQHTFWDGGHWEWPPTLPAARSHCSTWKRGPESSREANVTLVLLTAQLTSSCPKLVSLIWTLRRRCPRAWGLRSSGPDPPPRRALLPPCCRSGAAVQPRCLSQSHGGLGRAGGEARAASGDSSDGHSPLPRPAPAAFPSHHTPQSHLHVSHSLYRAGQPFATGASSAQNVSNSQVERSCARLAQEKERRHNEQNWQ